VLYLRYPNSFGAACPSAPGRRAKALAIREADEGEKLAKLVSGGRDAPEEELVRARRSRALGEAKPQEEQAERLRLLSHSTSLLRTPVPLALDFTWTAPDTCPTRAEVVQQLSKAVDADGKDLPPLSASAVVQRDGDTWHLELTTEMDGRRGTRLLEADNCEGLARAATLVMALTLGEGLARRQAEDEARAKQPPAPPAPRPTPPPEKPKLLPQPPPRRASLWATTGVGSDPLGSFGPSFGLGAAYQPGLLQLGLRLRASLPHSTELDGSGGEARSFSFGADVEACLAPTLPPFKLFACADGGVTLLDVEGRGTARDREARVPLYGLGPSLGADWLLGEHALLGLGLVSRFFVKRPELVVQGLEERRRVETASLSAELSGGVRW
jgi:hypothetical protein